MDKSIKIVFFGTPAFVVPILEALEENFQVVGIVTGPDQKIGRKQILTPSAVATNARRPLAAQGITLHKPERLDNEAALELKKLNADLFIVAAYGKIIPQNVLDIPKFGVINIHYSLLPKYRGASPIQAAILNGDKTSGTSIMQMDIKLDHGPVLATKEISLSNTDTFESLNTKMTQETIPLLVDIIPQFIAGKVDLKPQNEEEATFTKIINKEDGYFDIGNPPTPEKLDRMIRAYYPWPNAWTKWNGKIVKFFPGELVQMEGKNPAKLADFLRGYPDFPIKNLN